MDNMTLIVVDKDGTIEILNGILAMAMSHFM